jgi:hypothetical protein
MNKIYIVFLGTNMKRMFSIDISDDELDKIDEIKKYWDNRTREWDERWRKMSQDERAEFYKKEKEREKERLKEEEYESAILVTNFLIEIGYLR